MVAIDTNVFIAQQKKQLSLSQKQALAQAGAIVLPSIVVGELLFGAHNSGRPEDNLLAYRQEISRFLVLPLASEAAEHYARVRLELKSKGRPIPENDTWIAATCLAHGVPLFTLDRHFEQVSGLQLLAY